MSLIFIILICVFGPSLFFIAVLEAYDLKFRLRNRRHRAQVIEFPMSNKRSK